MADPNTRQGKRTPVTLKIKFKSETLEQFIERYAVDVSQGGIFIRTKEPLAVGTQMKFEFQLRDASPLIAGEGTVVWTRENDPSRPAIAPGMGVRFDKLGDGSQGVLEKILSEKAKQAPQRGANESPTKPPMFGDVPTRVAAMPLMDGAGGGRGRSDSEQTPLPKPMPFSPDAEDFDEHAFEEATKVRSLDELAAATAGYGEAETSTMIMPADELAKRRQQGRADSTLAEPPGAADSGRMSEDTGRTRSAPDRDSAPGLPSPPPVAPPHRPSPPPGGVPAPIAARPSPAGGSPRTSPAGESPGATRLGMEPARVATANRMTGSERAIQLPSAAPVAAAAAEPSRPVAPAQGSKAPMWIGIVVVLAAAAGAGWWFVLRPMLAEQDEAQQPRGDTTASGAAAPGSAAASGSAAGSAAAGSAADSGSAAIANGSAGSAAGSGTSAGSAVAAAGSAAAPAGPQAETIIASSVTGANVEVEGTDQKGPAPLTAHLVKDKPYKVRVSSPGFAAQELDVKGGQDKVTAKLVGKPHVLSVSTDPAGAQVMIDNVAKPKLTPSDIELTAAEAARPRLHVVIRKAGFKPIDQIVEAAVFADEDARVVSKLDLKLVVAPIVRPPPPPPPNPSGSSAGSASKPPSGGDSESGAAKPSGGDSGAAKPPSGGDSGGGLSGSTSGSGDTGAPGGGTILK